MGNQYANKKNPPFWTDERLANLVKLRKEGKSFGLIRKELGCTKNQALAAWNRRILKKKFPSDIPEEERHQPTAPAKPTLAWVPGVKSGGSYKAGVLKYD